MVVVVKSSKKDRKKIKSFIDAHRDNNKDIGVKSDEGKPELSLLFVQFPDAMEALVKRATYGHDKYKDFDADFKNWRRIENPIKRYTDAGLRHLKDYLKGEVIDEESGQPHLWAYIWCAAAVCQLAEEIRLNINTD